MPQKTKKYFNFFSINIRSANYLSRLSLTHTTNTSDTRGYVALNERTAFKELRFLVLRVAPPLPTFFLVFKIHAKN